jgi:hypothetical protein
MKIIKVLLIIVLFYGPFHFNNTYAQLSELIFESIFENAVKYVDLMNLESTFDYSETYDNFDFQEFKSSPKFDNKIKYKAFYKNNQLAKLSRYEKNNSKIIDFYFWDFDQYKIYVASTISSNYDKIYYKIVLSNVWGFFVYDKKLKSNKFIGLKKTVHGILEDDITKTARQSSLIKPSIPDNTLIRTIISLDKYLYPINRLNFYNNKLVSHSEFCFEGKIFYERLSILHECEFDISKLTFQELDYLLLNEPFDEVTVKDLCNKVSFKIGVILNQDTRQAIWADPNFGYVQSIFEIK